jgi:hypothetical protein
MGTDLKPRDIVYGDAMAVGNPPYVFQELHNTRPAARSGNIRMLKDKFVGTDSEKELLETNYGSRFFVLLYPNQIGSVSRKSSSLNSSSVIPLWRMMA